jgi:hypothetical protein
VCTKYLLELCSSNAVVLNTPEGVLAVNTRRHPRNGQDLIDRIRKFELIATGKLSYFD